MEYIVGNVLGPGDLQWSTSQGFGWRAVGGHGVSNRVAIKEHTSAGAVRLLNSRASIFYVISTTCARAFQFVTWRYLSVFRTNSRTRSFVPLSFLT